MEKIKFILLSTILFICADAAFAQPAGMSRLDKIDQKGNTSLGAELPRSRILPYSSAEGAMAEDVSSSTYIRPLDQGWKMKNLGGGENAGWQNITLPESVSGGSAATAYSNEFAIPFKWIDRYVFLHIGPVSRAYFVYVNDTYVGYHEDSKSSAEFNITGLDGLKDDQKNTLTLIAASNTASAALEDQIDTKGPLLEGDIYLFSQPRIRIRDWVADTRFDPSGSDGLFNLGVIVKGHTLNIKEVMVYYDLYAPDGSHVAGSKRDARFEMRAEDTVRFAVSIPDIQSWSHESPKLYTLALKLQHEGRYTEYLAVKVGFRHVTYDDKGIYLNGVPLQIKAAEYAPARDSAALAGDMARMRSKGINMVRVANYPQPDLFYRLADIYGIYVCDQANLDSRRSGSSLEVGGTPANDTIWNPSYRKRIDNMYHYSRNHPSVIMYSLGGKAGRGYNMYEAYLQMKGMEPGRPIVYEGAEAEWNSDIVIGKPSRSGEDKRYSLSFLPENSFTATPGELAPVTISGFDEQNVTLTVTNGFSIANLNNFDIHYQITRTSRVEGSGILPSDIPAGKSREFSIPTAALKPGNYTLQVTVQHKEDSPLAAKGEELASFSGKFKISKGEK